MNKYQTIFDEVHSLMLKETMNADLPIENRVFINSMLIFIDSILTHHPEVFDQVFTEAHELEEAKMN